MENLLVPSSIQRIRSFLVEMCGMKVKPWASTEEILAALHTTLVARHRCGIFWDSLRGLLQNLARDMKARASATPGTMVDNEVLDGERYRQLLDEIRQSLDQQEPEKTTFRHLSAALSAPALSLLLFLGGVVGIGCQRSGIKQGGNKSDAALAADAEADLALPFPQKGPPPRSIDSGIDWKLDGPAATPSDTGSNKPADGAPSRDAAPRGADGGGVTIQDIMDSCNVSEDTQRQVRACLMALDESWTTGLATVLAGAPCQEVNDDLNCFANRSMNCPPRGGSGEFVVGQTRVCDPILIYLGVRFV